MLLPSDQFRKLAETERFAGSLIKVSEAVFEDREGRRFIREVVHHPGAVVVVPLTADGSVVMVRQFRAAVGSELLEVPAGKRDVAGEPPEVTAERELAEETGRRADRLELLARFYNSPGFSDELSWLYLATQLSEVPHDRQGVEEQHMTVEEIPLEDVPELIRSGEIVDAKTIIGVTLAGRSVEQRRVRG